MRNTLRVELWKATHNRMFFLSLAVGLFLALGDSYLSWLTVTELHQSTLEMLAHGYGRGGHAGYSLFVLWMPINGFQITTIYFFLIWPALAAMPYGWSYGQERTAVLPSRSRPDPASAPISKPNLSRFSSAVVLQYSFRFS